MPYDGPTPPADHGVRSLWFLFLLALASLMWSAQGTAVKFLETDHSSREAPETQRRLGPITIAFLPFYVATALLSPLLIRLRRRDRKTSWPSLADWGRFTIAGVAGQVLAQLGMTWGVLESLASNGAVLNLLIPIFSAVLASLMLGERLTRLRVVCLAIGLGGVLLM